MPYVEGHTEGHIEGRVVGGREATDLHRAVPFAKKLLYNWRLTVATKGALSGLLDDLLIEIAREARPAAKLEARNEVKAGPARYCPPRHQNAWSICHAHCPPHP
jgi:hypothetical protein